jgi:hypothetical protein
VIVDATRRGKRFPVGNLEQLEQQPVWQVDMLQEPQCLQDHSACWLSHPSKMQHVANRENCEC